MSDSNRPRPRPKPRARTSIKSSSPSSNPFAPSTATSSSSKHHQPELEDEDASFMRNRTRTVSRWKKLEKFSTECTQSARESSSDGESESGYSTPQGSKAKKKSGTILALPSWTKGKDLIRLLSEDLDDDAFLEIENIPNGKRSENHAPRRKRARSRSRSITPPPALPIQTIQHARNLIRQTLGTTPRAASPTFIMDDVIESTSLDPELARIVKNIGNQTSQSKMVLTDITRRGGPEVVTIKVKWQHHPLNEAGRPMVWGFLIKRHDTLMQLFEETADEAAVLSEHLIVTYCGKRVFSSATPDSLKIWADAELDACDKNTYEYIRDHRNQIQGVLPNTTDDIDEHRYPASPGAESTADSDAESDKFKLILRSAVTANVISLTVRPTTTCGAIVKAFLKSAGLADRYRASMTRKGAVLPTLQIDGDKMDPSSSIGDADLEDGDVVDVVGL